MEAVLGFISIAAAKKKASRLLFHPISGFLPKTKFYKKKLHLMPLASLPGVMLLSVLFPQF